jgi:hypothetical protein
VLNTQSNYISFKNDQQSERYGATFKRKSFRLGGHFTSRPTFIFTQGWSHTRRDLPAVIPYLSICQIYTITMSYASGMSPRLARLEVENLEREGDYSGKQMEAEVSLFYAWQGYTDR